MSTKLRKGDLVEVIAGDYSAKNVHKKTERDAEIAEAASGQRDFPERKTRGRILHLDRKAGKVVVEGVNHKWHHEKARQTEDGGVAGGLVAREAPIHISNVMVVDPKSDAPARIRYQRDGKKKLRVAHNKANPEGTVLE